MPAVTKIELYEKSSALELILKKYHIDIKQVYGYGWVCNEHIGANADLNLFVEKQIFSSTLIEIQTKLGKLFNKKVVVDNQQSLDLVIETLNNISFKILPKTLEEIRDKKISLSGLLEEGKKQKELAESFLERIKIIDLPKDLDDFPLDKFTDEQLNLLIDLGEIYSRIAAYELSGNHEFSYMIVKDQSVEQVLKYAKKWNIHYACLKGRVEFVKKIIEKKPDQNNAKETKFKKTPLDIAQATKNQELQDILKKTTEIIPTTQFPFFSSSQSASDTLFDEKLKKGTKKIETKGDGNCFFHAVFGEKINGVFEAKEAEEKRREWFNFLNQFKSLADSNMPTKLKEVLEKVFNMFLEKCSDLTGRADEIKELVIQTEQKLERAKNKTDKLKKDLRRKFLEDETFKKEIYEKLKHYKSDSSSIETLIKDEEKFQNFIAEDLYACVKLLDSSINKETFEKEYNADSITKTFLENETLYQTYLKVIQNSSYYIFFEEIPILATLANIKITVYYKKNDQDLSQSFEPEQEMLNEDYQRKIELLGEKKSEIIYYQGMHYSRASIETEQQFIDKSSEDSALLRATTLNLKEIIEKREESDIEKQFKKAIKDKDNFLRDCLLDENYQELKKLILEGILSINTTIQVSDKYPLIEYVIHKEIETGSNDIDFIKKFLDKKNLTPEKYFFSLSEEKRQKYEKLLKGVPDDIDDFFIAITQLDFEKIRFFLEVKKIDVKAIDKNSGLSAVETLDLKETDLNLEQIDVFAKIYAHLIVHGASKGMHGYSDFSADLQYKIQHYQDNYSPPLVSPLFSKLVAISHYLPDLNPENEDKVSSLNNIKKNHNYLHQLYSYLFYTSDFSSLILPILEVVLITKPIVQIFYDFERNNIYRIKIDSREGTKGAVSPSMRKIYLAREDNLEEVAATLVHEFTHLACSILFENGCLPYASQDSKNRKLFSQINSSLSDFYEDWEKKGRKEEQKLDKYIHLVYACYKEKISHEEELIVRIPQILVAYSSKKANEVLNSSTLIHLFQYFQEVVIPKAKAYIEAHKNDQLFWNIHPLVQDFTSRETILEYIHTRFDQRDNNVNRVVVYGLGGIGKTQLVAKYVHTYQKQYTHCIWFSAENETELLNSYRDFAEFIELPIKDKTDKYIISKVKEWLENNSGWLVIYDNVPEASFLIKQQCLPQKGGAILVTSRVSTNWDGYYCQKLEVFNNKEAINYICKSLKLAYEKTNKKDIDDLVKKLGGFPLALAQACAYINNSIENTIQKYLTLYDTQSQKMLADPTLPAESQHHSVFITFQVIFRTIGNNIKEAMYLLVSLGYLNAERIPDCFLELYFQRSLGEVNSKLFNDALSVLYRYGLLKCDTPINHSKFDYTGTTFTVHRLIQEFIFNSLSISNKIEYSIKIAEALLAFRLNSNSIEMQTVSMQRFFLPHLESWLNRFDLLQVEYTGQNSNVFNCYANVLQAISFVYKHKGFSEEEIKYINRILEIPNTYINSDCKTWALESKAVALGNLGKTKEKEELLLQALKLRDENDHLSIATNLNNLGNAAGREGDFKKKMDYLKLALEEINKVDIVKLTSEMLAIFVRKKATILMDMGNCYGSLNNNTKKIQLLKEALNIHKPIKDDLLIAKIKANLANAYGDIGQLEKKIEILPEVLSFFKDYYENPAHQDIITIHIQFSSAYLQTRDFTKAIVFGNESIRLQHKTYGKLHHELFKPLFYLVTAKLGIDSNEYMSEIIEHLKMAKEIIDAGIPEKIHMLYEVVELKKYIQIYLSPKDSPAYRP